MLRAKLELLVVAAILFAAGCETTSPTEAVVHNRFAAGPPAVVLKKVWFRSTLWNGPIVPEAQSDTLRVAAGTEPAYAVIEVASRSFVVKSRDLVTSSLGDTTTILFSPATTAGTCFTDARLSREDYELVTTRIFPGEPVEPFDAPCEIAESADGGMPDAGTSADAGDDG